jgi:hypothetical protein
MRRLAIFAGILALSAPLLYAPAAEAKKGEGAKADASQIPPIEMTGVKQFDGVFERAKTIQDKLNTEHTHMGDAHHNLNKALGLAEDSPISTAMNDLKGKAAGKIKMTMNGKTPTMGASEAVPENVTAGIDATNGLITAATGSVTTALGLKGDVQALVQECAAFPGQVPGVLKNPMEAAKALKVVNANLKAIKAFPAYIDQFATDLETLFNDIKTVFPF